MAGFYLLVYSVPLLLTRACQDCRKSCHPLTYDQRPLVDDPAQYLYCDFLTRTIQSARCPLVNGVQKTFDPETKDCSFMPNRLRRTPGVPKSSRLGESCLHNTDCLPNLYCPTGTCQCMPGYIELNDNCVPTINPGQSGCTYDRQCSGAWPLSVCQSGVCQCPSNHYAVETQDGVVCVTAGKCPLPAMYAGTGTLDKLTVDTGCRYQSTSVDDDALACMANSQYVGDIYDCIPTTTQLDGTGACCPSRALTCIQPKVTSTSGATNRYWFNSISGQCETFSWNPAGNEGNSNNFQTYDHCMAYCAGTCSRGAALRTNGKATKCTSKSACGANYDCSVTSSGFQYCCPGREFVCGVNGGRTYVGPKPSGPDAGVEGTGIGITKRWFYDSSNGRCTQFEYKGLAGNFNNFNNELDCQGHCGKARCIHGEPLKDANGNNQQCSSSNGCPSTYDCNTNVCCPKAQTICVQPKVIGGGNCINTAVQRYWFNVATKTCEPFNYAGCGGNDNNFDSQTTCLTFCRLTNMVPKCVQGEAEKDSSGIYRTCTLDSRGCSPNFECYFDGVMSGCCPSKSYTCNLRSQAGSICSAPTVRFFYDSALRICRPFEYSGCDGNSNNFVSKTSCEQYCGSGLMGCPYTSGVRTSEEPDYWKKRVCDADSTCPGGYDCTRVIVEGNAGSYCCPSKAFICRMAAQAGDKCDAAQPTQRFHFNVFTKQCETFTYFGCGGNENNFVTKSHCLSFCQANACGLGETVFLDQFSQQPFLCNPSSLPACPNGYKCRQDSLWSRSVCCGSTDMGVCPLNEKAYVELSTQSTKICRPGPVSDCPTGFACKFNLKRNRYYCCAPVPAEACPAGSEAYIDPVINGPKSCVPTVTICPQGFSCQATRSGSPQGYCCRLVSRSNVCGNYAVVYANGQPRTCNPGQLQCPANSACLFHKATYAYYCCVVENSCPAGSLPYVLNGAVQMCTPGRPTACPVGYTCYYNPARRTYQCCGSNSFTVDGCPRGHLAYKDPMNYIPRRCIIGSASNVCPANYACLRTNVPGRSQCCGLNAGCPYPTVAFIDRRTGLPLRCRQGGGCPSGYACRPTSANGYICCSGGVFARKNDEEQEEEEEEQEELFITTSLAPVTHVDEDEHPMEERLIDVSEAECSHPNERPYSGASQDVVCDMDDEKSCPPGYSCQMARNMHVHVCCGAPFEPNQFCGVNQILFVSPTSRKPQTCFGGSSSNRCPRGYRCSYSKYFEKYYCCSIATTCPSDSHPYYVSWDGPRKCDRKDQACPADYKCLYNNFLKYYVCCSKNSKDTLESSSELETYEKCEGEEDFIKYHEPNATHNVCNPTNQHRDCPPGYQCQLINGQRSYRCCYMPTWNEIDETTDRSISPDMVPTTGAPVVVCRFGPPSMHPITQTPLVCSTGANATCPRGYSCEFSPLYLRYICCPSSDTSFNSFYVGTKMPVLVTKTNTPMVNVPLPKVGHVNPIPSTNNNVNIPFVPSPTSSSSVSSIFMPESTNCDLTQSENGNCSENVCRFMNPSTFS